MQLRNKNILLVSPEPWTHLYVSKHHYARYLAQRGNRVWFLNPPGKVIQQIPTDIPALHVLDYTGFPLGMRHYPSFLRRWLTRRAFRQLEKLAREPFDVLWSFDNSVFFQLDALPQHVLKISHIVDPNQDFETAKAARTADLVLHNTHLGLGKRFDALGVTSYFINHGLHVEDGNSGSSGFTEFSGTKVGYAGNLDITYLDWGLITQAVEGHPNVQFYFAGTLSEKRRREVFEGRQNVNWVGRLDKRDLTSFYNSMDILIIAYRADEFPEQLSNSHKVLEYLYSGKPVVATYTAEYADKDVLYMSERNADWPALFAEVVNNLEKYSTAELAAKRRVFALDNTYEKQIERIEAVIASVIAPARPLAGGSEGINCP